MIAYACLDVIARANCELLILAAPEVGTHLSRLLDKTRVYARTAAKQCPKKSKRPNITRENNYSYHPPPTIHQRTQVDDRSLKWSHLSAL